MITQMNVRAVRSSEGALELLGLLGYDRGLVRPYDLSDVGWQGRGMRLLSDRSPARGYGVVVAHTAELSPDYLVPVRCTGWRATHALAARFPDAYLQNSDGTRFEFHGADQQAGST